MRRSHSVPSIAFPAFPALVALAVVGLGMAPASAQAPPNSGPPPSSTPPGAPPPSAAAPASTPSSTLTWVPCEGKGLECTTLKLPVDYADLAAGQFDLAVVRHAARKPAERIGSLLTNPGGPGGSGVSFVINTIEQPGVFSDAILDKFDVIGFDPRGVVRSNGVTCGPKPNPGSAAAAAAATTASVNSYSKARSRRGNQSVVPFLTARARAILLGQAAQGAQNCLNNEDGTFLQNVTTKNVATDMDQLRQALGDQKLTFLGFSYGTYLGATYASLFPRNVRALALDGALPPTKFVEDPIRINLEQTASANQVLIDLFDFCAKSGCPFGQGKDPLTAFRTLVKELDQKPLQFTIGTEKQRLTGFGLTNLVRSAMSATPKIWPGLLQDLATLERRDPTPLLPPEGGGGPNDRPPSFSEAAFFITTCNDEQFPKDTEAWDEVYNELYAVAPDFAVLNVYAGVGCAYLDYETDPYTGPFENDSGTPILVVGGTKDSQTPFAWAGELTHELRNARLITLDGYGHVSYGPDNPCITEKVDAYLITGALPAEGTVCTQAAPGSVEMQTAKGDPRSPAPAPALQLGLRARFG
jgi:pimeloyl-ACP methyl ester carboxylesterase